MAKDEKDAHTPRNRDRRHHDGDENDAEARLGASTRGDSVDETAPMKKITSETRPAEAIPSDGEWDADESNDPDFAHPARLAKSESEEVEEDELDWGDKLRLTRQFMRMSRSSAVLMISFLLVLLLYLWVKEDPLVTLPASDPAPASETADPSATTEPTGETSATGTSEAEPSGTEGSSAAPTGTESAAPTADRGAAGSEVPTSGNSGQTETETGGTTGTNGTNGTGGTDGQGNGAGTDTGQGTGDAGQGAEGGTAQGAGTGQAAGAGQAGAAGQNAA